MKKIFFDEKKFSVVAITRLGPLENTISIILDHNTKKACVIDPACDADLFIKTTKQKGYTITDIWLTHWHTDHTDATDELAEKTNARILVGENEVKYLNINSDYSTVKDNEIIAIGDTKAKVINTPGHTAGGVCYLLDKHLITGDTLFIYGAGHCALKGASAKELFSTMQRLKKEIPDDTYIHCGHDYGEVFTTTMLEQKKGNPFLLINDVKDFIRYRNNIHDITRKYPMHAMTKEEIVSLL